MRRKGFTVVALILVVAIMGILASIAIPRFQEMQLRAKRAEAPLNVQGISTAAQAYYAAHDEWLTGCTTNPGAPLNKTAKPFDPTLTGCWISLGWRPDGDVRCTYFLERFGGTDAYNRTTAQCDVDDDNAFYYYREYIGTQTRRGYTTEVNVQNY